MIILDSSAAIKAVLPQKDQTKFQKLIHDKKCVSPSLYLVETSNALWKEVKFNELPESIVDELQSILHGMTDIIADDMTVKEALRIAIENNHPVYDCLFIALSRQMDAPILTADKKLIRKFPNDKFIEI